jgi:hypothetical protein
MPLITCEIEGSPGWKWGKDGKCYLIKDYESEEEAKQEAIDQGIAISQGDVEEMNLSEYASLTGVEIFRPGTHNNQTFSDAELDEMVRNSNECLDFIRQTIEVQKYPKNDALNKEILSGGKPIPALLNLAHQRYFAGIKDSLKDVGVSFRRAGEFILADITNVKNDVALALKEIFNQRSIEIIKNLYNPTNKKTYKNVIRSIGFLPPNIPPAVAGLNPTLSVEFASNDSNFFTIYSRSEEHQIMTEENIMSEEKKPVLVEQDDTNQDGVSIQQFQELQQQFLTLSQQFQAQKEEKAELQTQVKDLQIKNESAEIEMYNRFLENQRYTGKDGEFMLSQSFVETVKPLIPGFDSKSLVEFSEGAKISQREAFQNFTSDVIKMALNGSILIPCGKTAVSHKEPKQTQPVKDMKETILETYSDRAKTMVKDPNNENEVFLKCVDMAGQDGIEYN